MRQSGVIRMRAIVLTVMASVLPVIMAGIFPVLSVVAPKGTVIVLVVIGLSGICLAIRRGTWRDLFPPVPASLMTGAMGWMLIESVIVFDGRFSITLWLRLLILMLCGFGALWLFRTLPSKAKRQVHNALIVGILVSLLTSWAALANSWLRGRDTVDAYYSVPLEHFSSGLMIIAMVSALAYTVLSARNRTLIGVGLLLAIFATLLPMLSRTATVAMIMAVIGMALGPVLNRIGSKLMAVILMVVVLVVPPALMSIPTNFSESSVLQNVMKPFGLFKGLDRSVQHRLQIWSFVVDRANERPLAGWGLDASRRIPGGHVNTSLGEERLPLHPHNAILQVWLELGVPGVILLALIVGCVAMVPRREPDSAKVAAVRAGMIMSTMTVACLAFGVWQNWWVASLWLTAALATTFPAIGNEDRESA